MAIIRIVLILFSILLLGKISVQANPVATAAKKRAEKNCGDTLLKLKGKYKTNKKAMKYVNDSKTKAACEDAMFVQMGTCSKAFYRAFDVQTKGKKFSKTQLTELSKPLSTKMKTCMARSILQTTATIEKAAAETAKM